MPGVIYLYSPNKYIKLIRSIFGLSEVMFENESLMMQNLTSESPSANETPMLAGVIFDGVTDPNKPLPNNMKVEYFLPFINIRCLIH